MRNNLVTLPVSAVDSKQMLLRVVGKGNKERILPLTESILQMLREVWKSHRSRRGLFPSRRPTTHLPDASARAAFTQARDMAPIIVCGVALTLANNILSFAYHGYQPELYPTRIRARAVGFVYSFSRLSTMFSSFIIAWILREWHAPG